MYTVPFETRMTIVRLNNNKLWIHSPVRINKDIIEQVSRIGNVEHIVAPNNLHHLFIQEWSSHFSKAKVWVAEGIPRKLPGLKFDGTLSSFPEKEWSSELEQQYVIGSNFLTEVAFFHKHSKTLILTDLIQNHDPEKDNVFWRTIKKLNGILAPNGGVPRDLRLSIVNKDELASCLYRVLKWDFEQIVINHGICIERNAKSFFKESFSWVLKE